MGYSIDMYISFLIIFFIFDRNEKGVSGFADVIAESFVKSNQFLARRLEK